MRYFKELCGIPTAPFREYLVREYLCKELKDLKIPFYLDAYGNILTGFDSEKSYVRYLSKKSNRPVALMIAHMDHPGFHLTKKVSPKRFFFRWLGGSPSKSLIGQRVWCLCPNKTKVLGKITKVKLSKSKTYILSGELILDTDLKISKKDFSLVGGGLHFVDGTKTHRDFLYTNAADDLAGVATILSVLKKLKNASPSLKPVALFSIAEEIGWVGSLKHFSEFPYTKRRTPVYAFSFEASRSMTGGRLGKGPILRLGDKSGIFSSELCQAAFEIAKPLLKSHLQCRVMDGGTCEGAVSMSWGIPTLGLCVALGNYHNQRLPLFESAPFKGVKNSPAPEFVSLKDAKELVNLTATLLKKGLTNQDSFKNKRARFLKTLSEALRYNSLL